MWFRLLGDEKPDFKVACQQFTTKYMLAFNLQNPDVESIYYQSYASVMKKPFSDFLMLVRNFIINLIEGKNDGLVTPSSAVWTNFVGVWESATSRGISHADAVDLRRRKLSKTAANEGIIDICDC